MFRQARLKLTGWYLLIIMLISITFSGVIYRTASFEIERFASAQRNRFDHRIIEIMDDDEIILETKHRILSTLLLINFGILVASGIFGYYLSGKTLSPIQEMLDEQYRFVSDASHELKTPITAMKTTLEVAIRDKNMQIDEAKITLQTSLEEVNNLQRLAEGLLELTHKNVVDTLIPTNIEECINFAIKTVKPLATEKKIVITSKIPKILVQLDKTSITRAFVAILDNAVKYSPTKSRVTISSKLNKKFIIIQIEDQGVGIAKKDIPFVFDRLYRTDPARLKGGHGLGLSIAKQIIEDHSGRVWVTSSLNKGTVINIQLPYSARLQNADVT